MNTRFWRFFSKKRGKAANKEKNNEIYTKHFQTNSSFYDGRRNFLRRRQRKIFGQ